MSLDQARHQRWPTHGDSGLTFDHEVGHTFLLEHNVLYVTSFRLSGAIADLELHTGEELEEVIDRALLSAERGEVDRSLAALEEHVEGNTDAIDALNNRQEHASHVTEIYEGYENVSTRLIPRRVAAWTRQPLHLAALTATCTRCPARI